MKYNDNGTYKDIYVKTFDTLPIGTEVDYDGNTVPDGWSEIEDIQPNVYSTTEQKIGTWIDGKPIYRTILNPTVSGTGYISYSHGISNFSHIVKAYGFFLRNSGTISWQVINRGASDAETAYGFDICDITSSVYHLLVGTSFTDVANCYVILEYTKTTD